MKENFRQTLVRRAAGPFIAATLLAGTGCYGYLEGKSPGQVATPTPSAASGVPIPEASTSISNEKLLELMKKLNEKNKLELENELLKLLNAVALTPEATATPAVLPPPTPAPTAEPTPELDKSVFRVSSSENGWKGYSGKGWKVIAGKLANDGSGGQVDDSFLGFPFNPGENFTLKVDIRQDKEPYAGYGIGWKNGGMNCYVGVDRYNAFFSPGHPVYHVKTATGSDYTAPGVWRTHELKISGDIISYSIDGIEKFRVSDNKCTGNPKNRVGLWSGSSEVTVNNLEIIKN